MNSLTKKQHYQMNKKNHIRLASVFSGVGAIEQALTKLSIPFDIVFACDNGEKEIPQTTKEIFAEIKKQKMNEEQKNAYIKSLYSKQRKENMMKTSYFANYQITEDKWYEDIRFINGNGYKGKVDILVGGSPCQSFSLMGKRHGLMDTRGTLFFDYARLVKEINPPVFIYENVPGMLVNNKGNSWAVISDVFHSLGYDIHKAVLNAQDYGIPQNRKRLYVIGFKTPHEDFMFPEKQPLKKKASDFYDKEMPRARFFLGKKGFEFVTNPKYRSRARVNSEVIRTEKANQQFNWNGDFVFVPKEKLIGKNDILERAYIGTWKGKEGAIRQLTHRECFRLMGFDESFKIVVPNVWAYRQAGNSIVVNVLVEIMKQILLVEKL
jgi:DNA (cytosine-5)-methyltransferase 1